MDCRVIFHHIYHYRIKIRDIFYAIFQSGLLLIVIYAFLPESVRFSRTVLIAGTFLSAIYLLFSRWFTSRFSQLLTIKELSSGKAIMIGSAKDCEEFNSETDRTQVVIKKCIQPQDLESVQAQYQYFHNLIKVHNVNMLIFCSSVLPIKQIMNMMVDLKSLNLSYQIKLENKYTLIGDSVAFFNKNSKLLDYEAVLSIENQVKKRSFDIFVSISFLVFYFII